MVESVFDFADDCVSVLMMPRPDTVWLDLEDSPEENRRKMAESPYSRFPVCRGELDEVVGVVRAKDLLVGALTGRDRGLEGCLREPLFVPEGMLALRVLEAFRRSGEHLALVVDEYEGTAGLVTLQDVLEALVGDLPSAGEVQNPRVVRRPDGSWLLDGTLQADQLDDILGLGNPEGIAGYQTLAGFVLSQLGRIPNPGDRFDWGGLGFEVLDMDGRRVDKVLVSRIDGTDPEGSGGTP